MTISSLDACAAPRRSPIPQSTQKGTTNQGHARRSVTCGRADTVGEQGYVFHADGPTRGHVEYPAVDNYESEPVQHVPGASRVPTPRPIRDACGPHARMSVIGGAGAAVCGLCGVAVPGSNVVEKYA